MGSQHCFCQTLLLSMKLLTGPLAFTSVQFKTIKIQRTLRRSSSCFSLLPLRILLSLSSNMITKETLGNPLLCIRIPTEKVGHSYVPLIHSHSEFHLAYRSWLLGSQSRSPTEEIDSYVYALKIARIHTYFREVTRGPQYIPSESCLKNSVRVKF